MASCDFCDWHSDEWDPPDRVIAAMGAHFTAHLIRDLRSLNQQLGMIVGHLDDRTNPALESNQRR